MIWEPGLLKMGSTRASFQTHWMTQVSASTYANALLEPCRIRRRLLRAGRPAFQLVDESRITVCSSCKYIQENTFLCSSTEPWVPLVMRTLLPCLIITDRIAPHPSPAFMSSPLSSHESDANQDDCRNTATIRHRLSHPGTLRDRARHTFPVLPPHHSHPSIC